ncbi:MAG: fibronectin type III domain-containing protein [Nocardioidaceae bacterium]|nr:fibronectin type III domain-containing protein [Nocardioidaceae bacterium]
MHRSTTSRPARFRPAATVALLAGGGLLAGTLGVAVPASADNVNTAPTSTLKGGATQLKLPYGVATTAGGATYVANPGDTSILSFAADARTGAAPLRRISGPATLLSVPVAVALDANGFVYVSNAGGNGSITVYAPNANGDAAPVTRILGPAGSLLGARGLDVSPGGAVTVAVATGSVVTFGPSASGTAAPVETIKGAATTLAAPFGVLRQRDGDLTVSDATGSVTTFAEGADGNQAPKTRITGGASGLVNVQDVGQDSAGHLYVVTSTSPSIRVFDEDADGGVAPLRSIAGVATGLSAPRGIEVLPDRRIKVASSVNDSVLTFAPLFPLKPPTTVKAPTKPRTVTVSGTRRSTKRVLRWSAPASTGGAAVTSYRITVTHAGDPVLTRTVSAGARKATLTRSRLARGRNRIVVRAVNRAGRGAAAVVTIRVRK